MIRKTVLLLAATLALGLAGQAAAKPACGRACLQGFMTRYLDALVRHRPQDLPVSPKVRFTEETVDARLGDGHWKTVTGLAGYRQDIVDVRQGVVGSHVVVKEGDKPALLVVRLKVAGGRITEVETQITRTAAEGLTLFAPEGLKTASAAMAYTPTAAQRASREEAIRIAAHYPAGLQSGSWSNPDAPFAANAYRQENGVYTAGRPCQRAMNCKDIKTQPINNPRTQFQERLVAVDEEKGIVWYRLSWARGENQRLVVWEAFKVYDGKMQAVEAFMKLLPLDTTSGWDQAAN